MRDELRKVICPKCKGTVRTKSDSMIRCNKCGCHANSKFFKDVIQDGS